MVTNVADIESDITYLSTWSFGHHYTAHAFPSNRDRYREVLRINKYRPNKIRDKIRLEERKEKSRDRDYSAENYKKVKG